MKDIKINNDVYRETSNKNYYITKDGKIAKIKMCSEELKYFLLMKPEKTISGHLRVEINGKHYLVHRMVFEAWSGEKLNNEKVIDHIDANPGNNNILNLRQVTQKENIQNAVFHGNYWHNHNTKIKVINTENNEINIYDSVYDFLKSINAPDYMLNHGGLSGLKKRKEYKKYKVYKINEH